MAESPMSPAQRLQPAPRVFSTAFGLLMPAAAAVDAHGIVLAVSAVAGCAVLAGVYFRAAATLAVLLTVGAIVLAAPSSPVYAALSGLSGVAYLVVRHAVSTPAGVVTTTWPTVIAALGFTFAAVAATSVAPTLPWAPLLAPVAAVGIYALAVRPYLGEVKWPGARN
jgi:hypothetical protein